MFDNGSRSFFHGETYSKGVDFERLKNNQQRVFFLMLDGQWHLPKEIQAVGGAKGLTRVRALREAQYGGLTIEKERISSGLWRYRLDLNTVTDEIVNNYREWSFTKPASDEKAWVDRCRKRLHKVVDGLSDEQVKRLADFVRHEKWWKFGYHFYSWGQRGRKQ
jgi:hypothetical protein